MLKLENISLDLGSFALKNISFSLEKGDYFFLLGESGAGKSLILEMVAGLLKPDCGKILLNDKNLIKQGIPKGEIGLVFQDYALFPHLSVRRNIEYPLKGKTKTAIKEIVQQRAKEMQIEHLLDRFPKTLSGGEKQRVALARTMAMNPDILLLDEPLSSLDVHLHTGIRKLLKEINKSGTTIIHVTHNSEEASLLANHIAVISKGEIVQIGTRHDIFKKPANRFVASFAGLKNYFHVSILNRDNNRLFISEEGAKFLIPEATKSTKGNIIIPSKAIHISNFDKKPDIQNCFLGVVEELFSIPGGVEVKIKSLLNFYAFFSVDTIDEIKFDEGDKVWVWFKSSEIRFIGD